MGRNLAVTAEEDTMEDATAEALATGLRELNEEVERLRDELSNEIRFRHELVARLRIERDRYRQAIERHRQERSEPLPEVDGLDVKMVSRLLAEWYVRQQEADGRLWAALDGGDR